MHTETCGADSVLILNQEEKYKGKGTPLSVMADKVILISSPEEDNLKS